MQVFLKANWKFKVVIMENWHPNYVGTSATNKYLHNPKNLLKDELKKIRLE
jgi:hypothetical protein